MSTFIEEEHPRTRTGKFAPVPHTTAEVRLDRMSANIDTQLALKQHREDRHQALTAEGAFATPYDNEYIDDFEYEHPHPTYEDLYGAMKDVQALWHDAESNYEQEQRTRAVAELSRRIAQGQAGHLRDAYRLRPGDRIDISRIVGDYEEGDEPRYMTVRSYPSASWGEVDFKTDEGTMVLPEGAVVPVA